MIKISQINSQKEWDEIVQEFPEHSFLQAWSWGKFRESLGEKVLRYSYSKDKDILAATQIVFKSTRYGTYLYVPYGPLGDIEATVDHLKEVAQKENCTHIVVDPRLEDTEKNKKFLKNLKFSENKRHIQANHKWLLDIQKDEETLLTGMRKNTRYSIRKAEKEGIVIKKGHDEQSYNVFRNIIQQTANRKNFFIQNDEYYKKEIEMLGSYDNLEVFWAEHNNKPLSVAVVSFFGKHAAYLWGATISGLPNNLPASYPVIWEAIKEAKKRGVETFDFWGVAPTDDENHPLKGVSFFKQGFGGYYKKLVFPHELPITPKYWLTKIVSQTRILLGK